MTHERPINSTRLGSRRLKRALLALAPLWLLLASPASALAQTPGPPPVPLGEPMSRDPGEPGDTRPPMPGFESEEGDAQLEAQSPEKPSEEDDAPSGHENDNEATGEGRS